MASFQDNEFSIKQADKSKELPTQNDYYKADFSNVTSQITFNPIKPIFRGNRDIHSDETVKITVHTFFSGQYLRV